MNIQPETPQLEDLLSQAAVLLRDPYVNIERRAALLRNFLEVLDGIENLPNEDKFVTIPAGEVIKQEFPK